MPQRFAGINVADSSEASLIQKKCLQWLPGFGKCEAQCTLGKVFGEGINTQSPERATICFIRPEVNLGKMPRIDDSQHAGVQFEGNVYVSAMWLAVGLLHELTGTGKPQELAIEPKMNLDQPAIQCQEQVLSAAKYIFNACSLRQSIEFRDRLRLNEHGMKNMHAANLLAAHQWP